MKQVFTGRKFNKKNTIFCSVTVLLQIVRLEEKYRGYYLLLDCSLENRQHCCCITTDVATHAAVLSLVVKNTVYFIFMNVISDISDYKDGVFRK